MPSLPCPCCPAGAPIRRVGDADVCALCKTVVGADEPAGGASLERALRELGHDVRIRRAVDGPGLVASWRRPAPAAWPLAAAALVLFGATVASALSVGATAGLAALGCALMAVSAGYLALALATNRRQLVVGAHELTLADGPLPLRAPVQLPRADVVALRTVRVAPAADQAPRHEVRVRTRDGHEHALLAVPPAWAARIAERELARRLGLLPLAPPLRAAA